MLNLLRSPHEEIRDQGVGALVAVAMQHPRMRDAVIAAGAVAAAVAMMNDSVTVGMLRRLTLLIAVLCGASHPPNDIAPWETVAPAGTKLAYCLYQCQDEEVLSNTCIALSFLLPGASDTNDMMRRIAELVRYAGALLCIELFE